MICIYVGHIFLQRFAGSNHGRASPLAPRLWCARATKRTKNQLAYFSEQGGSISRYSTCPCHEITISLYGWSYFRVGARELNHGDERSESDRGALIKADRGSSLTRSCRRLYLSIPRALCAIEFSCPIQRPTQYLLSPPQQDPYIYRQDPHIPTQYLQDSVTRVMHNNSKSNFGCGARFVGLGCLAQFFQSARRSW